jgi:mannose-6-phosphate isomerase-like protein (cupin superfamily)
MIPETVADNSPKYDERPWGSFTVLDEGAGFKVKCIEVLPAKRLSYQTMPTAPSIGLLCTERRRSHSTTRKLPKQWMKQ